MFTWIHEHRLYWRRNRANRRYIKWSARRLGITPAQYREILKEGKLGLN